MRLLASLAIACLLLGSHASADFVLRVGNGDGLTTPIQVQPGGAVVVPVYGYFNTAPEAGSLQVNGFNLAFDFGADNGTNSNTLNTNAFGVSAPGDSNPNIFATNSFNFTGVTLAGGYLSFVEGGIPSGTANWDRRLIATFNTPAAGLFTTVPQRIFDITFTAGTTPGIYGINAVSPTTSPSNSFQINVGGSPYNFVQLEQGSIEIGTVTAVPEPSSMLLMGLAATGVVLKRRWKRKT